MTNNNEILFDKFCSFYESYLTSKFGKWRYNPFKRFSTMFFRNYIYPNQKKEIVKTAKTFFGLPIKIILPTNYDIEIYGIKGSDYIPDIRLTKYMIKNINHGDTFVDIGANIGYFSLLASYLVGDNGQVISVEPTNGVFDILNENAKSRKNMVAIKAAVSDKDGDIEFYEFDKIHSEQNSLDITFYNNEIDQAWMSKYKPKVQKVKAITVNTICSEWNVKPSYFKIDVQGAEKMVIDGGISVFRTLDAQIIMEFPHHSRYNNKPQLACKEILESLGYKLHSLNENGDLVLCEDLDAYFTWLWSVKKSDNDDMVFKKL